MKRLAAVLWAMMLLAVCAAPCFAKKGDAQAVPKADPAQVAAFGQDPLSMLSALGDRSTGSPGAAKAAGLIHAWFESLELGTVGRQSFQMPAKMYGRSVLSVDGRDVPIHPTDLNALTPAAAKALGGQLIEAGAGELADFNGKDVAGAVVLMNLDSGKNWMNAALLGARAVIYVDRPSGSEPAAKGVYQDKIELTPVLFPRFWVDADTARRELTPALGKQVMVDSQAAWKPLLAENVYLYIEGSDPQLSKQLLLFEAFYDSQAFVAGRSPGADEASSLTALMDMARRFKAERPKRSVLLAATAGHAQALAGWRDFLAAFRIKGKELRTMRGEMANKVKDAGSVLALLNRPDVPLEDPALVPALETALKDEVDRVSTQLMRLRLAGSGASPQELSRLTARRGLLRALSWRGGFNGLSDGEAALVRELLPQVRDRYQDIEADAKRQLASVESTRELRQLTGDAEIMAAVSLHLSSHGDGVGAMNDGWLYALKPEINRVQAYSGISGFLTEASRKLGYPKDDVRFVNGLRADRARPWRSYFVDNPQLGGEVGAISGLLGLTLATVNDGRFLWGTPDDVPARVDRENLARQSALVCGLASSLANDPFGLPESLPRNGFATLNGRAKFIRQGELFPDRAAPGTVMLVYQGETRFMAMAGSDGSFRVSGLADGKHVLDKAVIEGFKLSPETGEAVWAVDKKQTGKDAYRVRLRRLVSETDLVMFASRQSTIFSTFDPRTFRYFTKVEILDGRREAEPMRYWFSRLDTLSSTLFSVFLEPGISYKLILSDTVLARKMILLDSTKERPDGTGYSVDDWPLLPWTELHASEDMWDLLDPRITNLENHGIFNERIREMRNTGRDLLTQAYALKAEKRYDEAMSLARASWAFASRVYNDVEKTQKDVLMGVLFYIALFIPFAYCMERLIFAFADIHKRLLGFLGILSTVIAIIYNVHPAFKLTYSPMVVILAFFIIGMAVVVSFIIIMRFEQEMEELQRRAKHVKASEIGKLKAFAASFAIGVTNLRRRKIRTSLTVATLVILTFTIMSFTSVRSARVDHAVRYSEQSTYQGVMLKNLGWKSIPVEAENVLSDQAGQGKAAPRAVIESRDRISPFVTQVRAGDKHETVQGVLGLSYAEAPVTQMDRILTGGRWFREGERRAAILPESLAQRIGAKPGSKVLLWGEEYEVAGVFSGKELENLTDLDGEPLTPVIFPSETAVEVSETEKEAIDTGEDVVSYQGRYQHVHGDQVLILPYETVMSLGGQLKSVAVAADGAKDLAGRLADRFGLTIFAGLPNGTFVFHSSDTINYAGVPNIVVPLAIAMLIVLSTMIGAVYERKREIGVYTAVGLAPTHVSFLFIAEALAFAVLSAVLGYLLAQVAAGLLSGTAIWKGMTANYSSLAGVAAMGLVIMVVLLSVIYPSRVAANIAIPDVNRSWALPEPVGNTITATLPFLMHIREQDCAGGFLLEYYKAHQDVSHGLFSTAEVRQDFVCPWKSPGADPHPGELHGEFCSLESCLRIMARVWLAPFDFGINQQVTISFSPAMWHPGYLEIVVTLTREAGEAGMWKRLNKGFLDDLRKQMLVWRSLDEERRTSYESSVDVSTKNPDAPAPAPFPEQDGGAENT
ncbi:FtsX-like permease family protein [Fundidesulfovibrio putealis]|uniref:FtsX-like permease family protein n=1 Tax=Fundidesulfovibrio putealis TaxID=270496 RepID=UPI0003FDEF86|nr:FtsX-like permease family protein [Fundidesulfovibrio putealis]